MGSNAARLALVLLLHATLLLLSVPAVRCDDEEDHLLQGINSFRQSSRTGPVAKHDKANCVADEIADKLENQNCAGAPPQSQLASDYPNVLKKCQVDPNATTDGMILPVCVSRRVPTLVLTNYTQSSQNARYLNDSMFTGAGIGKEDDWTVLVLTTNTPGGNFATGGAFRLLMPTASTCYAAASSMLLLAFIMY